MQLRNPQPHLRCLAVAAIAALAPTCALAQPAPVLYVTTSAGFRHGSLETSVEAIRAVCARNGLCEVTHTEDTGQINAANLRNFRAVLFFTSGELALAAGQKQALLDFVSAGGSFGGFHSATDTLYSWPEYGELIGAYFDGHPWVQPARVVARQRDHPILHSMPSPWTLTEEYYQFRNFVQENTTILLELDKTSVDLTQEGVKATGFPLAWTRTYRGGRVFYTALGHFDETWRDATFQRLIENALAWMLAPPPRISSDGVGNAATLSPAGVVAPGSLISIFGAGLTAGERSESAGSAEYPTSLAGTAVTLSGRTLPLLYAGPFQINAMVPVDFEGEPCIPAIGSPCTMPRVGSLEVRNAIGAATRRLFVAPVTPGIFAVTAKPGVITVWGTGLGRTERRSDGLAHLPRTPRATVGGIDATVLYAGLSPEFAGLYQVNLLTPRSLTVGSVQHVELTVEGAPAVSAPVTVR